MMEVVLCLPREVVSLEDSQIEMMVNGWIRQLRCRVLLRPNVSWFSSISCVTSWLFSGTVCCLCSRSGCS